MKADRPLFLRPAWQFAFLTAVAVMIGTFLFTLRGPAWNLNAVYGEGRVTVNGETLDSHDYTRLAASIRPGAEIRLDGDVGLDLVSGDVLLLELDHGCNVTLPDYRHRTPP